MDKHAYCILTHGNWAQLQILIDCLDDERNDIYLHVDKKSYRSYLQYGGVISNKAHVTLVKSIDVRWSDISLADAEINLYESVLSRGISYEVVHLLSGQDLPLKSQNYIHNFFHEHRSEEFIDVRDMPQARKRLKYYHFFVRSRRNRPLIDFMRRLLLIPQLFFVNRLKNSPFKFVYGSEWCSLSYAAVEEIVNKYKEYRSMFKFTTCCDEHYKQMILVSNPHFKISPKGNLRYVVFEKRNPSPHVLTEKDYSAIMGSKCLFARKFDMRIDKNIIDKIICNQRNE